MANILSLALKINADASGLRLTPVERALQRLGAETDKVTSVFDKFAGTSEVAARAQADTARAIADLTKARQAGTLSAEQFAEEFQKVRDAALEEAAALQRAAQITEANLTPLQRYDRSLEELNSQLQAGRISQETYGRAVEGAAKGLTDAERAARGLAVQQKEIDRAAGNTTLKFNELSGVFSVLPGPLGNIAGRISGIASASEGLSRIFAGGLTSGISNLAASVTALINPFTLALAGITAFAAGAVAVVRGLVDLEDRVERLGNQAAQLGVSFNFIQTVEETARRSGVSVGSLEGAFTRLQRTLTEAGEGTKVATEALDRLGLTVADLDLLSEEEQFRLIGQRIQEIEDPAERTAAAVELFGRSGAQLLPFFRNLEGAANDIETFGAALSDTDQTNIDNLGAAFDQVGVAIQGLGQQALLPFVGLIEGIATAFSGLINIITVVAQTIGTVLGPVLNTVGTVFGAFGDAVNGTIGFFRSFFSTAEETAAATEQTAQSVERTAEEIKALDKAFADSQKGLDAAIAKAGEFGQAGFDAAFEFEQALADLQEQANEGELNAEQYARGVANATAEFEKQIEVARRVAEENRRLAEEAQRRAEAEAKAVQDIIDANLEQIRIDEQFGGDSSRARAADNLLKIQQEIVRVEEQLQAARAAGDTEAINALASRLATLDQVEARENDIASGAKKAREDAAKEAERLAQELNKIAADRQREIDRVNQQIADAQAKFADRQFEIELARAEELANVRTGSVEINDIRSGGISAFFDTLNEDPAIAEAKRQTKELEKLRKEIEKLNADKVDILAGTG